MNLRALFAITVSCVIAAVVLVRSSTNAGTQPPIVTKLYQTTRARLAIARARGDRYFGALIAAAPGHVADVAAAIEAAGGFVDYRADDVGYLRTRIPVNAVEPIAERSDVTAMDADAPITVLMPPGPTSLEPGLQSASTTPEPSASPTHKPRTAADEGPLLHPYRPQDDMGVTRLRRGHPLFDGRGVTVALLDPDPDFLLPELQHAKTLDGRIVPKFADIRVGEPPNASDPNSPWLPITADVRAVGGVFTYKGVAYHAPHDGDFALILAPNSGWYGYIAQKLDPKKKLGPHATTFAILWEQSSNTVWVGANRNDDFSNDRGLTDYAAHHEYGVLHIPTTDADARNTIGFVVQTAPQDRKVALVFGAFLHSTMTAGTIAANEDDGGRVEGIAPEAQLISIDEGGTDSTVIESAIWAERDPRVDLLCLEIISAESYGLKDGRFIESVIFNRLIRKYGKPILQPADNDFGMSRVEEPCDAATVTCVGAYESRASYRINSGFLVKHRDNLHFVGSFGPSGMGALLPSFLAPSGWIITGPGFETLGAGESSVKGLFDLPPGYMIGGGTSQATPTAAGAFAVLIGAAREMGLQISNVRLLDAATRTARYIGRLPAYEQGNGLIRVDAAYDWLRRWNDKPLPSITFSASVRTIDSALLPTPNRGVGFFEREGWVAGMRGYRTMTLTRLSGPRQPQVFHLSLIGNDGAFSMPTSVQLPLGVAEPVRFKIAPSTPGAHSAILRVRAADGEIAGETLLTVVAALRFKASMSYAIREHLNVPRIGPRSIFVTVPSGVQALVVRIATPSKFLLTPYEGDGGAPLNRSNNLLTAIVANVGISQAVFRYPRPGTWELQLIDYNDENTAGKVVPAKTTGVELTAFLDNVGVKMLGADRATLTQMRADLSGVGITETLAYRSQHEGAIARGAQAAYNIRVPSGATGIAAVLSASAGASADLYLLDCTSGPCLLREKSTTWGSVHRIYYDAPAHGLWKLIVDGYGVRARAKYELQTFVLDPFASPGAGVTRVVTASLPGEDPDVYYNECPPGKCGELPRRSGFVPIVFQVATP